MKQIFTLILLLASLAGFGQNYYTEDRWANLRFSAPIGMYTAPDTSNRIFVIEQGGYIKVFTDTGIVTSADTTTFLNVASKVQIGSETGLLGMAFHPNFSQNGYVYVDYTRKSPLTTIISRFKVSATNPNKVDPASEKILLQVSQPYSNHNAGSIIFGDDKLLYITLGDGGSGGDPGNRSQNKTVLLGKILRIDVDVPIDDSLYQIPPTNPFANNNQNWRKEIYATGVRNPWKISKDPGGSTIWMADVGQNQFEEVDTLRLGANYGWKVMEGNSAYSACGSCDTSNYEKPILDYPRNQGNSITGGFVYRGTEMPKLYGAYIYGDYGSRKVWALKRNPDNTFTNELIFTAPLGVTSFGLDNKGEIYTVLYSATGGRLAKIRCAPATPVVSAPDLLGCIGDTLTFSGPTGANLAHYQWSTGDTTRTIKISALGSYSVSLVTTNTFGCSSYASAPLAVAILNKPLTPLVPNVSACAGNPSTVSIPSSSLSFQWSTGSVLDSVTLTQSGNYWVIASNAAGCKSDTGYFLATFNPVPATPVIQQGIDNVITTTAVTNATYKWFLNGSFFSETSLPQLEVTSPGAYTLVVVSDLGCISDTAQPFTVTQVSPVVATAFTVSPNPTKGICLIRLNQAGANAPVKLEVVDIKGAVVYKADLKSTGPDFEYPLDISNLAKGTYTVKLERTGKTMVQRLVKE